ncbi:SgcJ/EcaC family oxidoreductase [Actinokineospora diospyrosa]|uniref:DUF4440 domain-containing protein n=1 Tax=Actinokineospora diospyrosa TaxID=103728 RepID=A0ABT1IE90_9PSEU|nr:SgcJ/EcaC family oxidoreductase [Actinokineospora diospyrosa]MCP2270962.1 hypothetical protein [Actinokineospora diospyrosa]
MSTSTAAGPSAGDQAAVAAIPQRVVAAWAANDAEAFASVFTDTGTLILPGLHRKGRAAITEHMAASFRAEYRGTRVTGKPIEVTFLGRDAGVLITEGGVLLEGETEVHPDRAIRASWVVVRQEDQWRLAVYQNCPRDAA